MRARELRASNRFLSDRVVIYVLITSCYGGKVNVSPCTHAPLNKEEKDTRRDTAGFTIGSVIERDGTR